MLIPQSTLIQILVVIHEVLSVLGMGEDLLKIDVTSIAVFLPTSDIGTLLYVATTVMGGMGLHIIEQVRSLALVSQAIGFCMKVLPFDVNA